MSRVKNRVNLVAGLGLILAVPSFFSGCSTTKKSLREHSGSYLESVKLNFEAGEQAMKDGEYDKAISYFQFVKSKYPFSQYASLSDLRLADVRYLEKKWLLAASAYEVFIRLHPRHQEVPYASFRVGMSYFHAVPTDFFLLPPAASRDQSFTKQALSALERFILQFPTKEFVPEAKEKQVQLFSMLAKHSMFVADYYERRGKFEAAVDRLLEVEKLYPQTAESAEALYRAAEILWKDIKDAQRAVEALRVIVEQKRESAYGEKADKLLSRILPGQSK